MFVTTKYEEAKNISRSLLNRNLADDYCYYTSYCGFNKRMFNVIKFVRSC